MARSLALVVRIFAGNCRPILIVLYTPVGKDVSLSNAPNKYCMATSRMSEFDYHRCPVRILQHFVIVDSLRWTLKPDSLH
jgi:hypothetical protein